MNYREVKPTYHLLSLAVFNTRCSRHAFAVYNLNVYQYRFIHVCVLVLVNYFRRAHLVYMPDFGKKWKKTKMRPCAQENIARRDSSSITILSVFVSYVCDSNNLQITSEIASSKLSYHKWN